MKKVITIFLVLIILSIGTLSNAATDLTQQEVSQIKSILNNKELTDDQMKERISALSTSLTKEEIDEIISNQKFINAAEEALNKTEEAQKVENLIQEELKKEIEESAEKNKQENSLANISKIPNTGEEISISKILISIIVVSVIIVISLFIYNRKKNA